MSVTVLSYSKTAVVIGSVYKTELKKFPYTTELF